VSAELSRCYELLGVKPSASVAELKAAYRDMPKLWHPDRFAADSRNRKIESAIARDSPQEPATSTSSQPAAIPVQTMATVTVLVDPSTGLLAKPDCPTRTRMTYAAGSEPHGYCTSHQKTQPGDSKVKTIAKRVVTPTEWVGSGKKKSEGDRQ